MHSHDIEKNTTIIGCSGTDLSIRIFDSLWLTRSSKWETRIAITFSSGMKNLPIAVGFAFASFPKLFGLPVALAMILQMLTASMFYRYLINKEVRKELLWVKFPICYRHHTP